MKLGFIGLGEMGKPMAINLIKSGEELIVSSKSGRTFPEFKKLGAGTTNDIEVIAEADIVFLCMPNSDVVESTCFGETGLITYMSSGQVLVDFSTVKYSTAKKLACACEEKNIGFLDAPISGMEASAIDGTLTIMCGGKEETFNAVLPYLKYVGENILLMGPAGSGQLTKLINNLLFDINIAAFSEILPMSKLLGLDSDKVTEIINSGTGRSYASQFFVPRALIGNFSEGYPMENAYKDLISAAEIAADKAIPLPILGAATNIYQTALRKGYGKLSKGAMIRVAEDLLGVEFRSSTLIEE